MLLPSVSLRGTSEAGTEMECQFALWKVLHWELFKKKVDYFLEREIYIYKYIKLCIYKIVCIHMYMYVYIYKICVYTYMCVCVCVCVYFSIYAFIGWFLHVPWSGIEPSTLVYQDDALTNWATWPGPALRTFLTLLQITHFLLCEGGNLVVSKPKSF